jgi:hypothetical protein
MSISPEEVIMDLENYIALYSLTLSKEARKTFESIEQFSLKCDAPCTYILFFSKAIRSMREMQKLFFSRALNPNLAAMLLEMKYYSSIDVHINYLKGTKLYSCIHNRNFCDKTAILDKTLQNTVKEERTVLENRDILLAAMDYYEEMTDVERLSYNDNQPPNNKLTNEYLTLAHVYGKYDENLWIKFDDIRAYLSRQAQNKLALSNMVK